MVSFIFVSFQFYAGPFDSSSERVTNEWMTADRETPRRSETFSNPRDSLGVKKLTTRSERAVPAGFGGRPSRRVRLSECSTLVMMLGLSCS